MPMSFNSRSLANGICTATDMYAATGKLGTHALQRQQPGQHKPDGLLHMWVSTCHKARTLNIKRFMTGRVAAWNAFQSRVIGMCTKTCLYYELPFAKVWQLKDFQEITWQAGNKHWSVARPLSSFLPNTYLIRADATVHESQTLLAGFGSSSQRRLCSARTAEHKQI